MWTILYQSYGIHKGKTFLQDLCHVPSTRSTSICMATIAIWSAIVTSSSSLAFWPTVWSIKHCEMYHFIIIHRFWNHTLIMILWPFEIMIFRERRLEGTYTTIIQFLNCDSLTAFTIPAEQPPCDLGLQQNPGEPFDRLQYEQNPLHPFFLPHSSQQLACFSITIYPLESFTVEIMESFSPIKCTKKF